MNTQIDALDHRILSALADADWHSGTELSSACGISRAALAKRMGKLLHPDLGIDIQSRHGKGYCLPHGLDLLETAAGHPHPALAAIPGLQILRSCDSTSQVLADHPNVDVALAEHQSQGRGRRGRQWTAPYAQNVLLSLRHRYDHWPDHLASLSLVLGLAVVRLLRERGIPAGIKWPNDIWLNGRKIGGILLDTRGEASSGCELIVGCGLNVHMQAAAGIDQPWTSLAAAGFVISRAELAGQLIARIRGELEQFGRGTTAGLQQAFAEWDVFANQPVSLLDGSREINGIQRGISPYGALRLESADGVVEEYLAGDLSLRRRAATSASAPRQ